MGSKTEITTLVPSSVVENFPEDESIVLAEVVRSFNEENVKKIRHLKSKLKKTMLTYTAVTILLIIVAILVILYIDILIGLVFLLSAFGSLGYMFYIKNKITKEIQAITSDIVVEGVSKVTYPLLVAKIGENYTLVDLGAHGVPEYMKYLDFREKERVSKAVRRANDLNRILRKIISIDTARELERVLVEKLNKQKDLEHTRALEGIFLGEVGEFSKIVNENIEENLVPSRFIILNDNIRKELASILLNARTDNVDPRNIEKIYAALVGLSLDEAIRVSENVFIVAEELAEEQEGKGLSVVVDEILDHIHGYQGLLENMRDLLKSTLSSDPITFHESIRTFFCPVCASKYIDDIRERIDVKTWVDLKVLGGGILDDPDLNNPDLIDPAEVKKFRDKIERIMDNNLPIPLKETHIALARPPILIHEGNRLKCPKCGSEFDYDELKSMNAVVPNIFIPLARGFAAIFDENKEDMINKASVIIRNVHSSKLSKNQRVTQLETSYKVHIEDLQLKLAETEAKIDQHKKVLDLTKKI